MNMRHINVIYIYTNRYIQYNVAKIESRRSFFQFQQSYVDQKQGVNGGADRACGGSRPDGRTVEA